LLGLVFDLMSEWSAREALTSINWVTLIG